MKLVLGCGGKKHEGYINLDIRIGVGDVQWDCSQPLPYSKDSVEEILTEAFVEHLFRHEATLAFKDWHNKLIPGGKLIIKWLPDFDTVVHMYVVDQWKEYKTNKDIDPFFGLKPFDWIFGTLLGCATDVPQLHKDIYTKDSIKERLLEAGFSEVNVYFCQPRHKELNIENPFPDDYYSLWIEAIK